MPGLGKWRDRRSGMVIYIATRKIAFWPSSTDMWSPGWIFIKLSSNLSRSMEMYCHTHANRTTAIPLLLILLHIMSPGQWQIYLFTGIFVSLIKFRVLFLCLCESCLTAIKIFMHLLRLQLCSESMGNVMKFKLKGNLNKLVVVVMDCAVIWGEAKQIGKAKILSLAIDRLGHWQLPRRSTDLGFAVELNWLDVNRF